MLFGKEACNVEVGGPAVCLLLSKAPTGVTAEVVAPRRCELEPDDSGGFEVDYVVQDGVPADDRIVDELKRLSQTDDDYWAFRRAARKRTQGLSQYPAMMVPEMQSVLVEAVATADGHVRSVYDPFVGSGTTLVESMRLGLDFTGQDINPLAVLFCRTKAGPFHTRRLSTAVEDVVHWASADRGRRFEANFPGQRKWFSSRAITELSRIRRAIRRVDHRWCRQVLWTGLAETVRLTSNSRTSTFKLHIRSAEELKSRRVTPLTTFEGVMWDITSRLRDEAATLREAGHLSKNGHYRGEVNIRLGDSSVSSTEEGAHDLVVTSPPYGDNTSTVPYGQYSFLPLQWIDLQDIDERASRDWVCSAYEIDRRSLGGTRRNAVEQVASLLDISPSLKKTLDRLEDLPVDRSSRIAAFVRDLEASIAAVVCGARSNAYMIWTIGNRRVGGEPVPTDGILEELLVAKGASLVTRLERLIPRKRMATRNAIASTMRGEAILVFRNA